MLQILWINYKIQKKQNIYLSQINEIILHEIFNQKYVSQIVKETWLLM